MKSLVSVILAGFAVGLEVAHASKVVDLVEGTFDDFITQHDVVMVKFYAPWSVQLPLKSQVLCGQCSDNFPAIRCAVCQELESVYEETASAHKTEKDIKFARVDCVQDGGLCKKYPTPIYPTFRVFKGLEEQEIYNHGRTPTE